ncbi:unnamed protein product [Rhodiola kirilowii]
MVFGQVIIGPPDSGKTTFCNGFLSFLISLDGDLLMAPTVGTLCSEL